MIKKLFVTGLIVFVTVFTAFVMVVMQVSQIATGCPAW